jgi:hypothetical protein
MDFERLPPIATPMNWQAWRNDGAAGPVILLQYEGFDGRRYELAIPLAVASGIASMVRTARASVTPG